MTSPVASPPSGTAPRRVFGASAFHTDGDLLALAFAPDGTLWSVEEPGTLRRWDVATRRQLDWRDLDEPATLWAFSGDARLVAAGSDEVTVWSTASGEAVAAWPQPDWVTATAFSPDDKLLATGHDDGRVRLWDWAEQTLLREIPAHQMGVSALAFSADGKRLASAGEERDIRLWDVATGKQTGSLVGHTDRVPALAWHPDGTRLYSAGWDTTARVWDVAKGEPIILLNSHAAQVTALALSPDGALLACADSSFAVHVWLTATNRTLTVLPPQTNEVRCLAFSPAGPVLASGGGDRVVHVWDRREGGGVGEQADPLLSRTGLAVSPDGGRLLSLGAGTPLRVWDVATGQTAVELRDAGRLRAFAAGPDGRWIACSVATPPDQGEADLALWDVQVGRRAAPLEGQRGPVTALAFRGDGKVVATGGFQSSDVWLWQVPTGEPLLLLNGAADGCSVEALAFHPDNRRLAVAAVDWLATGGSDGKVVVWDTEDRRAVLTLKGGAVALALSPDGTRLATASLAQTVRLWGLDGRLIAELRGHVEPVTCLAFSPDGRWLATGGDDRTARLWSADGRPVAVLEIDTQVKALAFAPDGRQLFTGNANTSCYLFEVERLLSEGA
jgi:WD40 repeat protein